MHAYCRGIYLWVVLCNYSTVLADYLPRCQGIVELRRISVNSVGQGRVKNKRVSHGQNEIILYSLIAPVTLYQLPTVVAKGGINARLQRVEKYLEVSENEIAPLICSD